MKVRIHEADKKILEAEADEVVLPGWDGEFAVMDFHQPCLYGLRAGRIRVKYKNVGARFIAPVGNGFDKSNPYKNEDKITIKKGIAKMVSNELVVLVET